MASFVAGWFVQLLTLASFLSGWIAQLLTLASFLSGSTFWSDDNTPEDGQPHSFHILSQKIAFCLKDLALSFQPGTLQTLRGRILGKQACAAISITTRSWLQIGQWYPCELNIEDQCRTGKWGEVVLKEIRKLLTSSSVILLQLILAGRGPEAEFVWPIRIDLRCVERV